MRPDRRSPCSLLTLLALLVTPLSACTTLRIEASSDDVRIERHFGLLGVRFLAPHRSVVTEMSGFGVLGAPGSLSFGYASMRFAGLAQDCRVVLWLEPGQTLPPETVDRLRQVASVCLFEPKP